MSFQTPSPAGRRESYQGLGSSKHVLGANWESRGGAGAEDGVSRNGAKFQRDVDGVWRRTSLHLYTKNLGDFPTSK